jgi:DNA-binding SARP family transcriptional activator/tetratricopeptide (TPR) repeat protein
MRVRLLGPVDVLMDGEERPVAGLRRKAVLATLALHGGEVVSTGRLVDAVWDGIAPPTALNTLQHHVSHLRAVLGGKAAILARPPGYLLDLGQDGTDVRLAERLLRQGTQSADPGQGAGHLRQALALWRGRPLADVTGLAWLEDQAGRLDLLRQQIRRALSEVRLAAGDHLHLVPELEQLAADHPLDEQLHAQLMIALYRCGRQADALSVYQRLRVALAEELGIDTSKALCDLETAILRQDPSLDVPVTAGSPRLSAPIPAQLPPGVAAFAGRGAELDSLDTILSQVGPDGAGNSVAVVITAIAGTAGVGKTALALHWAHRVATQFPDGQLYANLRGFDPAGPAVEPGQALRGFLDALAVPPQRIPASLEDQVALYRSLLTGKRMLIVLDNARDAEQVRTLLPGAPGCLAIVTSRNRLTGLIARDGAHPLSLDVLTPAEARELLTRRLGTDRVGSEPDAVENIITRCARLPLALAIVAARAAASPRFPLAHFAAEIREAGQVLDLFRSDDAATDVSAVFSWSYRALSTDAARLFRLLGLHPGPDFTVGAAASLAGIAPDQARALLAELTRGHLLTEHRPGRYAFHDLLRAYAAEQARSHDHDSARDAAVGRLLGHCLHTAYAAATLTDPCFAPVAAPVPPQPRVVIGGPATAEEALSWFTAEHPTLLAAVPLAAESGAATHAWQLAWVLGTYLLRQGLWTDQATACRLALDAARRDGDTAGEAHALVLLGLGYGSSGRLGEAALLLRTALRLLETVGGCHRSQVRAHRTLSWIAEQQERHADMLSHATAALELSREAGDLALEVMSLNDVGYSHALLGNYRPAIVYCERSLAGSQEAGERNWESAAWDSLGYIHHQLGDHRRAITCYERSLDLSRTLADRYNEAGALDHLGDVHRSAYDMDAARWAWIQAARGYDEIGHPRGEQIRAKLGSLGWMPPPLSLAGAEL